VKNPRVLTNEEKAAAGFNNSEVITIPNEQYITQLLEEGHDNFTICQLAGCAVLDVVNVARKVMGISRMIHELPTPITDSEFSERLLLFPSLDEDE